ncbi:hypothetical protein [Paenibacillus sabinae]|uniref:Uncharacterized protein n=1 Tax=Paenibacillus sabinae T27 TaxID=1268072 RepID=X4ZYP2_9BACL|nr:hypothetical protein [Paenibacillus sabinae]AHV97293.1 hypothetical protein PSAB_11835 [Paenibacillus sabinae T27]
MAQPGIFYGGGLAIAPFFFFFWLISAGLGIYAFVLFVKLARRGIEALDLYIYTKNREIRDGYETYKPEDRV